VARLFQMIIDESSAARLARCVMWYLVVAIVVPIVFCTSVFAQPPPAPIRIHYVKVSAAAGALREITWHLLARSGETWTEIDSGDMGAVGGSGADLINTATYDTSDFGSYDEVLFQVCVAGTKATLTGASFILSGDSTEPLPLFTQTATSGGYLYDAGIDGGSVTARSPSEVLHVEADGILADGRKTVWATGDSTLTANLFREGVDKIIAQGGGGGSAGTASATANLTNLGLIGDEAKSEASTKPSDEDIQAAADAAGDAARTAMNDELAALANMSGNMTGSVPTDQSGSDIWKIHMPGDVEAVGGAVRERSLSPAVISGISAVMGWVRLVTTAVFFWFFEMWLFDEINRVIVQSTVIRPAQGTTAPLGIGYLSGLGSAVLTTAVLMTLPSLLIVYMDARAGDFAALVPSFTEGGSDLLGETGSHFVAAFWMLDMVAPMGLIIALPGQVFIIKRFLAVTYFGVQATIRFLVT